MRFQHPRLALAAVTAVLILGACGETAGTPVSTPATVAPLGTVLPPALTSVEPPSPSTPTSVAAVPLTPTSAEPPSTGVLEVTVTDQPARDIDAILVTTDRVEVNRRQEDGTQDWVTVVDEEVSFDLLQVAGIEMTLGSAEMEPGVYLQIRMHVVSVKVTVDGREVEAKVPSGIIRVVRPMTVVAGEVTIAAFDFDARKSVVVTGADRVLFKPVIKLLVRKGTEPFRPELPSLPEQLPVTPAGVPQATPTSTSEPMEATATPVPSPTPSDEVAPTATPTPSPTPSPTPAEAAGTGTIEIQVTDPPPPDIEHYMVTLSSVEVHKAKAGEGSPWITIFDGDRTFDLIDLGEIQEFLADSIVGAGLYTQIRLHVASATLTLADGEEVSAKVPSEKIQIVRPFRVVANETTVLLLDFDGDRSIVVTGGGKFIFKPVIKLSVPREGGISVDAVVEGEDTTAPTITVMGVSDGNEYAGPVTPEFSVADDSDAESDLTVSATLNGEPFVSGTEIADAGDYELKITAVDTDENEAEVEVEFEIVDAEETEDTTAPTITITGVSDGNEYTGPVTPEFSVADDTDAESDLTISATLDGESYVIGTAVSELGSYTFVVTAEDTSANEAEAEVEFEIVEAEEAQDTTAPTITITGVSGGDEYTGPVTPEFSVTDDTDAETDLTISATLNGEPYVIGTAVIEVGSYTFVVTAEDTSENEAEAEVEFEIVESEE